MSLTVPALLAPTPGAPFERGTIERRELGEHDVLIDIAYAGICHSDIHQAREEWGKGIFPMVPGHEIAGVVSAVGSGVTKHAVGDRAGVGCFVDSCRDCDNCNEGLHQYCVGNGGMVGTYNAVGRPPVIAVREAAARVLLRRETIEDLLALDRG